MRKSYFEYPESNKIRVIADADAKCEVDDQFTCAHQLMTSKFDMRALISEHFEDPTTGTEERSYNELCKIVDLMELTGQVNILHGAHKPMPDESTPIECEGAQFIIEEALRDDPRPLFVVTQGPLTTVGSAIAMKPEIADKFTLITIGGMPYPEGGWETNYRRDLNAVNVVYKSNAEIWQVPFDVYTTMRVPFAELWNEVHPCGKIGKYLVENMMEYAAQVFTFMKDSDVRKWIPDAMGGSIGRMTRGEAATNLPWQDFWSIGDSPINGLLLWNQMGRYTIHGAPTFAPDCTYILNEDNPHKIRVYTDIDHQFIIDDFKAKIKWYFGNENVE